MPITARLRKHLPSGGGFRAPVFRLMLPRMGDDSPTGAERAVVQRAAEHVLSLLTKQQEAITAEHSAMLRWLTASLLVVNGGGALAVFNAAASFAHPGIAAAFFIAGILSALAVGVLVQWASQAGNGIIGEAIGQAYAVAETGEYGEEAQRVAEQLGPTLTRVGRWPPVAGWVSAILFLSGTIAAGVDRHDDRRPSPVICRALLRDMLSEAPRRSDAPAIYQALGCRAQR